MNRSSIALEDQIRSLLARGGQLTGRQLQQATGKSQASISLAIGRLGEAVCKLGAARSTRYALTRDILGLAARQPIQLTGESGRTQHFGDLTLLADGATYVRTATGQDWLSPPTQLPWFLTPLKPQGFLGRQYAYLRPDFPPDPDDWRTEQTLYIAANHSVDPPGAFQLGPISGRLVPEAPQALPERAAAYDERAQAINQTLPTGSSAGGEQPKFLAETGQVGADYRHLIVKFTPPRGTPFGERWHDLLQLEQLASVVLAQAGIPCAGSAMVESSRRIYLESHRFDRVGVEGKRHVVALSAIHDEFVGGPRRNWVHSCEALLARKLITADELHTVACVFAFGHFIGNTDMHYGNLSFRVDDVFTPTLRLAPVYDMLPMLYRPSVHDGSLDLAPVRPQPFPPGHDDARAAARGWAIDYWTRASNLAGLSTGMRAICQANALALRDIA